jgi:hypothetical protein
MTDTVRKEIFGVKSMNSNIQLSVRAKIFYDEDPFSGGDGPKLVSKPMALIASNADSGPQRITVVSQAARGFSKRALMEQNEAARMSVYAIKTAEEEFMANENSFIDPIFDDEHEEDFQNEDKSLNDFLDKINERFSSETIENETNEEVLRKKAEEVVFSLFEAQKIYYTAFYKTQSLNRFLRELLVKYNQKYRIVYKKYNRLREQFESNNIRKNITALNTDENKRILKAIEQSLQEIEVYKSLFKLAYNQEEVLRFKEELPVRAENKRNLMLKVVKNVSDRNAGEVLHDDQKLPLEYIVGKYKLKEELPIQPLNDLVTDEQGTVDENQNGTEEHVASDNEGTYEQNNEDGNEVAEDDGQDAVEAEEVTA